MQLIYSGVQDMVASTRHMEHRWGTRIDLNAPAELWTVNGAATEAMVRNASLSGAFLETTARVPLLTRVAVRPLGSTSTWLDGCVVRRDRTGLALEWLDPGVHTLSPLLP
jgi:hypothetical protein